MALITCTECGKKFSDKAAACPECGCPTEEIIKAIKSGNTAPRKAEPQSDAGITVTISKKPLISAEDAAKKMKEVCARAITEAESASNSFDFANKMIQTKASGTMDLFGSDTLSRVADIAADVKKACDELYSVLQVQVITVDSACRPLMESDPGVEAICDAACTIAYLNEESRISNNFTGSLNGSASSGLASARYSPSIDSVAIEKFWAASLNEMPGGKEARNAWHANRRKAEQEKRDATRRAEREYREYERREEQEKQEKIEKKKQAESAKRASDYEEYREIILKQRKTANSVSMMYSAGIDGYVYLRMDGTVQGSWCLSPYATAKNGDTPRYFGQVHNAVGCAISNDCVVILRADGTCATNSSESHYGAVRGWRNITKLAAAEHFIVGLCMDGTCVSTYERAWSTAYGDDGKCKTDELKNIADIACAENTCYALTKDGNLMSANHESVKMVYDGGDLTTISANYFNRVQQLAGLRKDGTIYTKGVSAEGIGEDGRIVQLAVAGGAVYALMLDGSVKGYRVIEQRGRQIKKGECTEKEVVALCGSSSCLGFVKSDGSIGIVFENSFHSQNPVGQLWNGELKDVMAEKEAEQKRIADEKKQAAEWKAAGLCPYCGGQVKKGLLGSKCLNCGKRL